MAPDSPERARWRRVLTELGATERQADVALLVHEGLEDKEIAKRLGTSVSTVRVEIGVLFAILKVPKRKRHLLGVFAARVLDTAPAAQESPPLPEARIVSMPRPQLGLRGRKTNRKARGRPGQRGDRSESESLDEPLREAPEA